MTPSTYVDLSFPARGETIPRDHGYALYGAVSRVVPTAHGATWLGIHGLEGRLAVRDGLDLRPVSVLKLRAPIERIPEVLALAGATIEVAGNPIHLGAPTVRPLVPAASLDARLVIIRLTGGMKVPFDRQDFDKRFEEEAKRQFERLGVVGELALRGRRSVRVGTQRVIGHAMKVIVYWFGVNGTGSVEGYGERERNLGGGRGAVAHRRWDAGRTHDGAEAGRPWMGPADPPPP